MFTWLSVCPVSTAMCYSQAPALHWLALPRISTRYLIGQHRRQASRRALSLVRSSSYWYALKADRLNNQRENSRREEERRSSGGIRTGLTWHVTRNDVECSERKSESPSSASELLPLPHLAQLLLSWSCFSYFLVTVLTLLKDVTQNHSSISIYQHQH
jgi:hypothetical protein